MSPYALGGITGVISPQNILVDRMPCHVRNLCPIICLSALESGSDGEFSTQSASMITISDSPGASSPRPDTDASNDTSADKLSGEDVAVVLPQRTIRHKRLVPGCHICDHEIRAGREYSRSEKQDELLAAHSHQSKR